MKAPPRVKTVFYVLCGSIIASSVLLVLWMTASKRTGQYDTGQNDLRRQSVHPLLVSYHNANTSTVNQTTTNTDSGRNTVIPTNRSTGTDPTISTGTDSISTGTDTISSMGSIPTGTDTVSSTDSSMDSSAISYWFPPRAISHYGIRDWSAPSESPLVWEDQFCREFLGKTFDRSSIVCENDRIVCYGTHHNKRIGKCIINRLAVKPHLFKERFAQKAFGNTKSAWLVSDSNDKSCTNPKLRDIRQYMEDNDPFHKLIQSLSAQAPGEDCTIMVRGVSFFYMGVGDHIYFKMLSWYNLHRTLLQYLADHRNISNFIIVRLPESNSPFKFLEFEQSLFPQSFGIDEFPKDVVCFERVIFVPWTYAATPFRCKMDGIQLKSRCMGCHGNGLETDLRSFRRRVLSTCSLDDAKPINKQRRTFLIIQRKQYLRRLGDTHSKFQRIWTNSKDLIDRLTSVYPNDNIVGIYGEDLSICDQVRHAHNADVLIGMHGAGLVHIWWLRDDSISFELVPPSQRGNGAFSTLSTLLGKKHHLFNNVKERGSVVTVDIDHLLKDISSKI